MAKWSGRGIPPTRKKLHRLRERRARELAAEARAERRAEKKAERKQGKVLAIFKGTDPERTLALIKEDA